MCCQKYSQPCKSFFWDNILQEYTRIFIKEYYADIRQEEASIGQSASIRLYDASADICNHCRYDKYRQHLHATPTVEEIAASKYQNISVFRSNYVIQCKKHNKENTKAATYKIHTLPLYLRAAVPFLKHQLAKSGRQQSDIGLCELIRNDGAPAASSEFYHILTPL